MKDLWRLIRLHRPEAGWMLLGLLLALLTLLANLGLLALSGWFIASMALAGLAGVSMNYFTPAAMIRACAIVRTAGRWGERVITHEATFRIISRLRVWLYQRIEPLAPAGLQGFHGGDLLSRLTADIDRLDNFYPRILLPIGIALLGGLILLGFVARYNAAVAGVLAVGLSLAGLLLPWSMHRAARPHAERIREQQARLRSHVLDSTQSLAELTLYGALPSQAVRIDSIDTELHRAQRRHDRLHTLGEALTGLISGWSLILVSLFAIPAFSALSGAQYAMLALLTLAAFETVAPLPLALQLLPETLAAARRVFALADTPPPIEEPETPEPAPKAYDIHFHHVSLYYPGRRRAALEGIDLGIAMNSSLAIVGASGAGKTSLLQLLLRFRDYAEGEITLGGTPLRQLRGDAVRRRIASLSQHSHLFNASIRDNLLIADPRADQAALQNACARARIADLVERLPDGFDTWIGEAGARLSGGERRRLALARALLKPAPILLLDEPTEGLDYQTEQLVTDALGELLGQRTLIIVTHKAALLRLAERVLVLERGKIVACDSHGALLETLPGYRDSFALPDAFA